MSPFSQAFASDPLNQFTNKKGLPYDLQKKHNYHPCMLYIYLHLVDVDGIWLILMANAGKYTSPMDAMGHNENL